MSSRDKESGAAMSERELIDEVMAEVEKLGYEPRLSTPAEFAAYIKSEIPKWSAVVQAAGARVD